MENNNTKSKKGGLGIMNEIERPHSMIQFTSFSESIAKTIIEKLISLTMTQCFVETLEERIPDECSSFVNKVINSYLSSAFITYDKDDHYTMQREKSQLAPNFDIEEINDENNQSELEVEVIKEDLLPTNVFDINSLYFDNFIHGNNDWETLNEPQNVGIDRYASSFMEIMKAPKETNNNNNDQFKECMIDDKVKKSTSNMIIYSNSVRGFGGLYTRYNQGKVEKKKRKLSIEINTNELPKEDFEQPDQGDLHIEILRKEKEDELKKIDEEAKKNVKKQIEVEEKIKEAVNIQKEYEKKNITIDANGKIVFVKVYPIEKLTNEFISARTDQKEIKIAKPIQKKLSKKKTIIERTPPPNDSEKKILETPSDNKGNKEDKKDKKNLQISPIKDNKKPAMVSSESAARIALEKKIERGPIHPSGSCYDRIALEIGVSFTEENKYKTGGKDYYKAYNKYSLDNYSKQVKEAVSYQSYISNVVNKTMTDYNHNTNNLIDTYSTNFNATTSSPGKIYNANMTSSKVSIENLSTYNPFLKTGKLNCSNLPLVLNSLDLIDTDRNQRPEDYNNYLPEDIFKATLQRKQAARAINYKNLESMNNFTQTIIKSDRWGINEFRKPNIPNSYRLPTKPHQSEKFKLGSDNRHRLPHKNIKAVNPLSISMEQFHTMTPLPIISKNRK